MIDQVIGCLLSARFPLNPEKATQAAIASAFERAGVDYSREVHLGDGDIVDFMVAGVAIEVKIKGQRREIYKQLERYARHEAVTSIVLATQLAMGLPESINGKRVLLANLGRAWL